MIIYSANFVKSNGTLRKIRFARLADVQHMLPASKGGSPKQLAAHQEMVWDLDENNYRIFNWSSTIGDVIAKRDF